MFPDVALLEIFECYMDQVREDLDDELTARAWSTLVHVCQKWRSVVFGSPRRLGIRLFCTETTPVKEMLGVWPPFPIVIGQYIRPTQMDSIIGALKHNDRVCKLDLFGMTNSQLEEVLAATQQPFPVLASLIMTIWWDDMDDFNWWEYELLDGPPPVVPDSFLGGSAPRLEHLTLERLPFPGLPKLLLSATGLVSLYISQIPHSGYISPQAMVCCLSTLTRLEELKLGFQSPLSRPVRDTRHPHPPTRSTLPSLTHFRFIGATEYLEDLVARIDALLLDSLHIRFFHRLIFDAPQLAQFLARTSIHPPIEARIDFFEHYIEVTFPGIFPKKFVLAIGCRQSDWQLSSLSQVLSSSLPEAFISTVEHLYICEDKYLRPHWQDDIEDSQWLDLLHPFTAVKNLYLSREFVSRIAPVLQEFARELLPSLQNLSLQDLDPSGPVNGDIGKFVAARQLTSLPVAVSHWDGNQDEW